MMGVIGVDDIIMDNWVISYYRVFLFVSGHVIVCFSVGDIVDGLDGCGSGWRGPSMEFKVGGVLYMG